MTIRKIQVNCVATLMLFLLGCSGPNEPKQREVFPVKGVVTYKGKPMPDASVVLHPVNKKDDGLPTYLPRGHVDEDGKFSVSTYQKGDGAPAGTYKVSFSWQGPLKGVSEEEEDKLREKIPRKYRNPNTSGFIVTILETENSAMEFVLK
ncbi:MAG: DUF4198 domain-containing protein [Planctomycetes bacterium]|nr:DUF4198 domain-containing protein [Planctomycetota bacterium]MCH9725149.1 DUF4198 domain-containing protein [Planctomycetota bacterium]MCH9774890.1 DUF4198 domain-containing protein [Planctomycetota bacterium]MDF1744580.1 carboxypeptidase-like regulatory domain-containing protein [Gimesia sp.]